MQGQSAALSLLHTVGAASFQGYGLPAANSTSAHGIKGVQQRCWLAGGGHGGGGDGSSSQQSWLKTLPVGCPASSMLTGAGSALVIRELRAAIPSPSGKAGQWLVGCMGADAGRTQPDKGRPRPPAADAATTVQLWDGQGSAAVNRAGEPAANVGAARLRN